MTWRLDRCLRLGSHLWGASIYDRHLVTTNSLPNISGNLPPNEIFFHLFLTDLVTCKSTPSLQKFPSQPRLSVYIGKRFWQAYPGGWEMIPVQEWCIVLIRTAKTSDFINSLLRITLRAPD